MAIERGADAELGAEFGLLVGAHALVAIADGDIGIAGEEDAAVGQPLQRGEAAQRVVARKRIVEEGAIEGSEVEAFGERPGLVLGQLDQAVAQAGAQNCSSVSAKTVRPAALSGPSWASAGGRITSAKKRAVTSLASRKAGSPSRAASLV